MLFERITSENLTLALEVARGIFPYEVKNGKLTFEDDAYRGSIREGKPDFSYSLVYEDSRKLLKYGPVLGNEVVGITGWYREDDGTMWLGWFGVLPDCQGFGLGPRILTMTAEAVAGLGVKELFIYSGQRAEERTAHKLYERMGFVKTGEGQVEGEPVFYFRGPVPIGGAT